MKAIPYSLILASQSPRRQQLMKDAGYTFEVRIKDTAENYPAHLKAGEIAKYIAELKAAAFKGALGPNELLITADTIVWLDEQALGKPMDRNDAVSMLKRLSGKMHRVYTGVCLSSQERSNSFASMTEVYFKSLTINEIEYYIDHYKPFDKAGSYGAQDWLGLVGLEKINGSYFNVMGLPVKELYEAILQF
jgi:septum formation protein